MCNIMIFLQVIPKRLANSAARVYNNTVLNIWEEMWYETC